MCGSVRCLVVFIVMVKNCTENCMAAIRWLPFAKLTMNNKQEISVNTDTLVRANSAKQNIITNCLKCYSGQSLE